MAVTAVICKCVLCVSAQVAVLVEFILTNSKKSFYLFSCYLKYFFMLTYYLNGLEDEVHAPSCVVDWLYNGLFDFFYRPALDLYFMRLYVHYW